MKKIITVILFIITISGFSQSVDPSPSVSDYINQAEKLSNKGKYLTAVKVYKKTIQIVPTDSIEKQIDLYYRIGNTYLTSTAKDSAKLYIKKANQMLRTDMSKHIQYLKEYNNANYFSSIHQNDKAMSCLLKALEYAKSSGNNKKLSQVNLLIGKILLNGKEFNRAKKYFDKSLIYAERSKSLDNISIAQFYLGNYYFDQNKNDKADKYIRIALTNFNKLSNLKGIILAKSYIGQIYLRKGNNNMALKWSLDAFELMKQLELSGNAKSMINITKKQIKITNSNKRDSTKLKELAKLTKKSMKVSNEQDAMLNMEDATKHIIRNQHKNNNLEVKMVKKMYAETADSISKIKDSIWKNRLKAKYAELEQKYQAEKKELENKKLTSDNQIQKMALQNEKRKKRIWLISSFALILFLLILSFLLFRIIKQKKHIEEIHQEVYKKNQLITQLHKDMHHRVKGNLGMISVIISRLDIDKNNTKLQKQVLDLQNRIITIEDIHRNLLYDDNMSTHIKIKPYIQKAVDRIANAIPDKNISTKINIDNNLQIHSNIAFIIALIVNEFVTNTYKYAFDKEGGNITIVMNLKQNNFHFSLADNGKGLPKDINIDDLDSFGLDIIKLFAEVQLNGTFDIFGDNGTKVVINFPIKLT